MVRGAQLVLAAAFVAVACAAGAAASAPNYRFAVNARDVALAKRIAAIKGDLPTTRLKGGLTKPDRSPDTSTCKGQPRQNLSGLTISGDAAARYELPGAIFYAQVQLFAKPAMTEIDWQRNHPRSGALACFGREVVKTLHEPGAHIVRTTLLPVPELGDHQYAARAVAMWPGAARAVLYDVITVSTGRVEYTLVGVGGDGGRLDEVAMFQAELRVLLGLEARARDLAASGERGPAPRIDGTFQTSDRVAAVVHVEGLGHVSSQPWAFAPLCAAGGCVTTMSHPSLEHPGTTFHATFQPAGSRTYRARYQKYHDCTVIHPDGTTSTLPNQWLDQIFVTLHVTVGADGKATGYTGTRLVRSTPLAGARAQGCTIVSYQLDEVRGVR